MLTTCPECQTTFRVTQEHLGLRRGLVRCGHCGVVFNGYDSLLAELVAPPVASVKDSLETAPTPFETLDVAPPLMQAQADAAPESEAPESPVAEPPTQPEATPVATSVLVPEPVETSESILLSELPTRIRASKPARPPHYRLKLAAALLLAGILLLQTTVFLRAELAAALPATRPLLLTLCRPLGCLVPLPRQLDKTAISASSLEHDAENKSRVRLSLLLANTRAQAQTWPHIVLILTDVRDAPVAQRVFSPKEYLATGTRLEAGMAAGEEQEIRLDLDTGTLAATGYALDLAYR
jgi:predicted Zn finger-like uncharacterized protein